MGPHMYYSFCLYNEAQKFDPSYPWPQITELWLSVVVALCVSVFKGIVMKITYGFHRNCVKNVGIEEEDMTHKRAMKMGKYMFQFCYFILVTGYGYYTLMDEPWLHWTLGGKAEDFQLMQVN